MSNVQEPDIRKGSHLEETFRKAVIEALENLLDQKRIAGSLVDYFILQDFGLDIAVFMKWPNNRFTVRFWSSKLLWDQAKVELNLVINKVKGLK